MAYAYLKRAQGNCSSMAAMVTVSDCDMEKGHGALRRERERALSARKNRREDRKQKHEHLFPECRRALEYEDPGQV